MSNVIYLSERRARDGEHADEVDALAHLGKTADAMQELLRACIAEVGGGALDAARMQLAGAALAMLGPGWELRHTGGGGQ